MNLSQVVKVVVAVYLIVGLGITLHRSATYPVPNNKNFVVNIKNRIEEFLFLLVVMVVLWPFQLRKR